MSAQKCERCGGTGRITVPSFGDNWRRRWLVARSYERLHRIAVVETEDWDGDGENGVGASGRTVCGLTGWFAMPGIFSRMGRPRCAHCCDRLRIPRGDGAPANSDEAWCDA